MKMCHQTSRQEPVELLVISIPLDAVKDVLLQLIDTRHGYVSANLRMDQCLLPIFDHFQTRTNWN